MQRPSSSNFLEDRFNLKLKNSSYFFINKKITEIKKKVKKFWKKLKTFSNHGKILKKGKTIFFFFFLEKEVDIL